MGLYDAMTWLPRFKTFDHTTDGLDDQIHYGTELCIQWGRFVLMIVVARRQKTAGQP